MQKSMSQLDIGHNSSSHSQVLDLFPKKKKSQVLDRLNDGVTL
jgi:hypothetical protein